MKKLTIFLLLLINTATFVNAQSASIGIDSTNFSIPPTTYFNNTDTYHYSLINYGNQTYNGYIVIEVGVDSTNSPAAPLIIVAADSFNVNLGVFGSHTDSIRVSIDTLSSQTAFKQGINTVVIWPKNYSSTPNAFIVHDSLTTTVMVLGYAGISEQKNKISTLIFPNPMQDRLTVINNSKNSTIEQVRIFSTDGQLIRTEPFKNYIDVGQLQQGIYLIEFIDSHGNVSRYKAIKE